MVSDYDEIYECLELDTLKVTWWRTRDLWSLKVLKTCAKWKQGVKKQ